MPKCDPAGRVVVVNPLSMPSNSISMQLEGPLITTHADDDALSLLALTAVDDGAAIELDADGQMQRWRYDTV